MSNLQVKARKTRLYHYSIVLLLLFSVAIILSGCASTSSPVGQGFLFTNVRGPVAVTQNEGALKVGYSNCTNVLGFVAAGDSSISAAMKQGGISKIHHVDNKVVSILFFFTKHTTIVYGE